MGRKRLTDLDLPNGVYRDRSSFRYRAPGKPRRSVTLCKDRKDVERALLGVAGVTSSMDIGHLTTIRAHSRKNAKTRSLDFALSRDDVLAIWQRSGGTCEVSGLKFDLMNPGGYRRRPFAPSIDRIDSTKGYTIDNCRLVVLILNLAINEFGEDVFAKAATAFLRHRAGQSARISRNSKKLPQITEAASA